MMKIEHNVGVGGQYRAVIRRADGSIKFDSGEQNNLIVENFFRALATGNISASGGVTLPVNLLGSFALVGDGTNPPAKTDTTLQSVVAGAHASGNSRTTGTDDVDAPSGYKRMWMRNVYIFEGISNKNISEVGLGQWSGNNLSGHGVYTRALIKDINGSPTTITVLAGEVLEVQYQLNMFIEITHKTGEFTLRNVVGAQETTDIFEYRLVPLYNYVNDFSVLNRANFVTAVGSTTVIGASSAFDLNSPQAQALSYDNRNGTGVFSGELMSNLIYSESAHNGGNTYVRVYDVAHTQDNMTVKEDVAVGNQALNLTNGIRGIVWPFRILSGQSVSNTSLLLVRNKANGDAINKTVQNKLQFTVTKVYSRMG